MVPRVVGTLWSFAAAACVVAPAAAQATDGETRAPPCSAPEHRQFDFWIGEWDVLTPDGQRAGGN